MTAPEHDATRTRSGGATGTSRPVHTDSPDAHSPDDLLRLDQQVCFALAVAARTVIGLYRPVLEPLGLTHPQYLVMLALWERSPLTWVYSSTQPGLARTTIPWSW